MILFPLILGCLVAAWIYLEWRETRRYISRMSEVVTKPFLDAIAWERRQFEVEYSRRRRAMELQSIEQWQNEWRHHGKPPLNCRAQIWVRGQVRTGRRDGFYFNFDDCTHPAQNCITTVDSIDAWRLV